MAIPICKRAGARHVVITDVNPYRLNLARTMEADFALDVRTEKLAAAMQKLGMKEGFDVALEMSGNPKAFADILPNMFHGGKIALLGIMPGSTAVDWNTVVFSALTIKGIYGREMYETWYKMTAMIQSGLDISPVITHRFPYTEFKEAIELMKSGNSGKIVLNWGELRNDGFSAFEINVPAEKPPLLGSYRSDAASLCRPSSSSTIRWMCR